MKVFQKESNGYTLSIRINEEELFNRLDEEIAKYEDLKKKYDKLEEEREGSDDDYRWEYDMQSVYGDPESDWCTPDEIIEDLNKFKSIITNAINGDGSDLWNKVDLKKNGTFKKNSKPTLKEAINGTYWEDSYGWRTQVLRLEPWNDTNVNMTLDRITLHY